MRGALLAGVVLLVGAVVAAAADRPADVGENDLIDVGRAIYHEGRPSAGPLRAVLVGDTGVTGSQFACVHCHRRSGLGASEGNTGTLPVAGSVLYEPRHFGYRPRPAYTDATLARALRTGVDSGGQPLGPPMPRYELADRDMAGLIAYLKTLSAEIAPGLTDTEIHFATVVTDDVDQTSRQAMLDVLRTFFREKNGGTRHEARRSTFGPFPKDSENKAYRKWTLHEWALAGPPHSWPDQLDAHYRRQPVFAMLSGISTLEWQPVHAFCEERRIPCVLPNTDVPPATNGDFYSIYFSQGMALEARAIVAHVSRRPDPPSILQLFRPQGDSGAAAAALRDAAGGSGALTVIDWALPAAGVPASGELLAKAREVGATVLVLWLAREDLAELARIPRAHGVPAVYLSSTLVGGEPAAVPETLRPGAFLAHPYTLPEERGQRMQRVAAWLQSRKLELRSPRVQAQTHFACLVAAEGLMQIRRLFYRDYFVDSLEHAEGITALSALYPRLSFGPGQRYLAKGSYVLELGNARDGALIRGSSWLVPEP
jgi:hypothetical protein